MQVGSVYLITSADGEDFSGTVVKNVPGKEHNNDFCDCSHSDLHLKTEAYVPTLAP